MRVKRISLVLDPELLDQARRLLGVKTYSGSRQSRLAEALRLHKVQSLPLFFGKGLWQGDLSEMRDDFVPGKPRPTTKKRLARIDSLSQ